MIHSKKGLSLVSLLVGVGLAGFVLLMIANVITSTSRRQVRAEAISQLQYNHLFSTSILRSINTARCVLRIDTSDCTVAGLAENAQLRDCLGGNSASLGGFDCRTLEAAGWTPVPDYGNVSFNAQYSRYSGACAGANCEVEKAVDFQALCSRANKCEQVQFRVRDTLLQARVPTSRESLLKFSSDELIASVDLDFSCGATGFVTGFDNINRVATCQDFSSANINCINSDNLVGGIANVDPGTPANSCTFSINEVDCSTGTNYGIAELSHSSAICAVASSLPTSWSEGGSVKVINFRIRERYERMGKETLFLSSATRILGVPAGGIPASGINFTLSSFFRSELSREVGFPDNCYTKLTAASFRSLRTVSLTLNSDDSLTLNGVTVFNDPGTIFHGAPAPNLPGNNSMVNFTIDPGFCVN